MLKLRDMIDRVRMKERGEEERGGRQSVDSSQALLFGESAERKKGGRWSREEGHDLESAWNGWAFSNERVPAEKENSGKGAFMHSIRK